MAKPVIDKEALAEAASSEVEEEIRGPITSPKSCHPYFKLRKFTEHVGEMVAAAQSSWSVPALCKAYQWPTGLAGGGTITIVELGGGWIQSDMVAYFASIGQPVPTIIDVSVDGTKNSPGGSADVEVALDIQLAAASYFVATGKPAEKIAVFWAQDIAAAVTAASQYVNGPMAVFAAAGDNDSSDGGRGATNVDVPAACPHTISLGGTRKTATAEIVWNDNPGRSNGEGTGGGYSAFFAVPAWQKTLMPRIARRMVPDMAANADPVTGFQIIINGQREIVGGTSADAPLLAGLFAAFGWNVCSISWGADEADWGRVAANAMEAAVVAAGKGVVFVSEIWQHEAAFTDITHGSNGAYSASVGPDPCSGLGAPIGTALAKAFVK